MAAIDSKPPFFTFHNQCSSVLVKMVVRYSLVQAKNKVEVFHDQTIHLPENATDIQVWFEAMRFLGVYSYVKKWNRKDEVWDPLTQRECFEYSSPPKRSFTTQGLLYYEAITEVKDENSELILTGN